MTDENVDVVLLQGNLHQIIWMTAIKRECSRQQDSLKPRQVKYGAADSTSSIPFIKIESLTSEHIRRPHSAETGISQTIIKSPVVRGFSALLRPDMSESLSDWDWTILFLEV